MVFYNENDPKSVLWLRELIARSLVPDGFVEERSIRDVRGEDVVQYRQCHFFAGIAGWSEALRLAGWPEDREIWTGSCPCQPYSSAGRGLGDADERNLWPEFFRLIRECHPPTVVGEQVEAAIRHGWLDRVFGDLESEGYSCGAAVLGAHSVGAPHIRQRLYWAGHSCGSRLERPVRERDDCQGRRESIVAESDRNDNSGPHSQNGGMGNSDCDGSFERITASSSNGHRNSFDSTSGPDFWSDYEWIECRDGRSRRTQSGLFPLANGVSARMVKLRGYGNAIVPQVAAEFIRACA